VRLVLPRHQSHGAVAEVLFDQRKYFDVIAIPQQGDANFAALNVLLHQCVLLIPLDDGVNGISKTFRLRDQPQAEAGRFVSRLHDHWKAHSSGEIIPISHYTVGRRWNPRLPQQVLGDHLVQRQGMAQRIRAGVGHARHLQHGGHMGIAAIPLDAIGHVEHHAGRLTLGTGWHELIQRLKQSCVSLAKENIVAGAL